MASIDYDGQVVISTSEKLVGLGVSGWIGVMPSQSRLSITFEYEGRHQIVDLEYPSIVDRVKFSLTPEEFIEGHIFQWLQSTETKLWIEYQKEREKIISHFFSIRMAVKAEFKAEQQKAVQNIIKEEESDLAECLNKYEKQLEEI